MDRFSFSICSSGACVALNCREVVELFIFTLVCEYEGGVGVLFMFASSPCFHLWEQEFMCVHRWSGEVWVSNIISTVLPS